MDNEHEATAIFKNVSDYLIQTGKTVIVSTTNEHVCALFYQILSHFHFYPPDLNRFFPQILKLCNRIYLMDNGHLTESYEYDDLEKMMAFKKIMSNEKQLKLSYQLVSHIFFINYFR